MPEPISVLYLATAYARDSSDLITPWLGETIRRLAERSITVEVLAPAWRGSADQTIDGVRVHRFRYALAKWEVLSHDQSVPSQLRERPALLSLVPAYLAANASAAIRLTRSRRFAAVHALWPLPHGLAGLAARRVSGVPLVTTFFGAELTWRPARRRIGRALTGAIVRGSDAVTAISSYTARELRAIVPDADPEIIPFGATVSPDEGHRAAAVPSNASNARAPFAILFVSRLVARKGVNVLLDAMARLRNGDVTLTIVGDGPERSRLEELAHTLGIASRVRFSGRVSNAELGRHFSQCDLFVLPSIVDAQGDTEGLGVPLIEAMSYGKPVIASDAGGMPDIVRHGVTGTLVPPGDAAALAAAIDAAHADRVSTARLAAAGREFVERNFSWPVILDRLESIYRRVARTAPRP